VPVPPATTTVALSAPTAGATFGKSLAMAATASPATGASVTRVEFWLDGTRIARDTAAPYRASWTVPSRLSAGSHTLSARALDNKGAVVSAAVTVLHTTAGASKSAVKRTAASPTSLSSAPAADGGTDLTGAAGATSVVATLAPCSGTTAKNTKKVTLRAASSRLSGHQKGRLCVVGLAPAGS
jgi:hypothetical protein